MRQPPLEPAEVIAIALIAVPPYRERCGSYERTARAIVKALELEGYAIVAKQIKGRECREADQQT